MSAEVAYKRFHESLKRAWPQFVTSTRPNVVDWLYEYEIGEPDETCKQALALRGPHALFWRFRRSERDESHKQLRVEVPAVAIPRGIDIRSFFTTRQRASRQDIFLKDGHWHVARTWGHGKGDALYDLMRPGSPDARELQHWAMNVMCDALELLHGHKSSPAG